MYDKALGPAQNIRYGWSVMTATAMIGQRSQIANIVANERGCIRMEMRYDNRCNCLPFDNHTIIINFNNNIAGGYMIAAGTMFAFASYYPNLFGGIIASYRYIFGF